MNPAESAGTIGKTGAVQSADVVGNLLPSTEGGVVDQSLTLFDQPWWLDTVAPGGWKQAVVEQNGDIVARMPYFTRRGALGMKLCTLPPYTRYLGPWVAPGEAKYSRNTSRECRLIHELIDQIPKCDQFEQAFDYHVSNVVPFHWHEFLLYNSYTFVFEDISDPGKIWNEFQPRIRNNINRASDRLVIRDDLPLTDFKAILEHTYRFRRSMFDFHPDVLDNLYEECLRRNAGKLLAAVDEDGVPHAAAFIVWDHRSAYFLLGGINRKIHDSHANSYVIWEAIKHASTVSAAFNFNGNMNPDVFPYFLKFGAVLKPFYIIRKRSLKMAAWCYLLRCARLDLRRSSFSPRFWQ